MKPQVCLRLLGTVALDRDGTAITGRAAQRMRIALLAILALAPGRTSTRDRLTSLLWPETDTDRARHLLAGAIYDLRRALGEDALLSRGDDVELDAAVDVDALAFEAALASSDPATAITLYRGPLLDGFHLPDAGEFERWLDTERDRLARQFSSALEMCARELAAAGDVASAASQWRRLASLEPYNSRIARELMLALEAAGDRAGALQFARTHELLLREEFDVDPDPETTALVQRLRMGPPPAPAPQPSSLAPPAVAPQAADGPVDPAAAYPVTSPPGVARVPTPRPVAPPTPRRWRRRGRTVLYASALASLAFTAVATGMWVAGPSRPAGGEEADGASVAVLPFRNMATPGDGVLADALSDEIITALSRVPRLPVAARSSSFMFRDVTDVTEIRNAGERLGVTHVLYGSLHRDGDLLAVTARLGRARDGMPVWEHTYTIPRQLRDIMSVQEQIAQAVLRAVEGGARDTTPLVSRSTDNLEAFNEYQAGRQYFHRRTVADMWRAHSHFLRAIELDSTYARAHAGIAEVYVVLGGYDYGVLPPRVAYPAARSYAERALDLQPDLAEAYTALGGVYFNFDRDWDAAEQAFARALQVNPGYSPAYHWQSLLYSVLGRVDDARTAVLRAAELDPLSLIMSTAVARQLYYARDFEASIRQYRRTVDQDSTYVLARLGLGISLLQADRLDEAQREFETAQRLVGTSLPVLHGLLGHTAALRGDTVGAQYHLRELAAWQARDYVPAEYVALIHLALRDHDAALAALEQAAANRSGSVAYFGVEPILDPVRSHPRFIRMLHNQDTR